MGIFGSWFNKRPAPSDAAAQAGGAGLSCAGLSWRVRMMPGSDTLVVELVFPGALIGSTEKYVHDASTLSQKELNVKIASLKEYLLLDYVLGKLLKSRARGLIAAHNGRVTPAQMEIATRAAEHLLERAAAKKDGAA